MPASSKLFHAVVLMGYALGGCRADAGKAAAAGGADGGSRGSSDLDAAGGGTGGRPGQADAGRAARGRDGGAGMETGVLTPIKHRLHDAGADADAGSLPFDRDASTHDAGPHDAGPHDAGRHTAADGGDAGWPSTK